MRRLICLVFVTVLSLFLFAACGRSGLGDYELADGGLDSSVKCGPTTCPGGCCDENGTCRSGTDLVRCGTFGRSCSNCAAQGFDTCNAETKSCGKTVAGCNAQTCPNGCCALQGGRDVCLSGSDDTACGVGGRTCDRCSDRGQACDGKSRSCGGTACDARTCPNGCCSGPTCFSGRDPKLCGVSGVQCDDCQAKGQSCQPAGPGLGGKCTGTPTCSPANCPTGCCNGNACLPGADDTACGGGGLACSVCPANTQCNTATRKCEAKPACGPGNCAGCCLGDICVLPGDSNTACGKAGLACANCAGAGKVCQAGACVDGCNATSCPSGCCKGNTCLTGTQDNACGKSGATCADCTGTAQICNGGTCQAPCGPTTCPGCCQGNTCQAGFLNNRCGSGGGACSDCTTAGQTCDTSQLPRICTVGGTCPSAYPACPGGVTTAPRTPAVVCGGQTLVDARVACTGGPNTTSCTNFFQFLNLTDPGCGVCLSDFRFNFNGGDGRGVYKCVAPFVDAACNRNTGCASDCENTSCAMCPSSAAESNCRSTVRGGQCQTFNTQTTCATTALLGTASFCNPATYGGNFGTWLEGVGGRYCNTP